MSVPRKATPEEMEEAAELIRTRMLDAERRGFEDMGMEAEL